jgi:hypothetical protein
MNEPAPRISMDTKAFLALLHGDDALIYFQVGDKTWKNKPQTFRHAEPTLHWRNGRGEGICFVVNAGGTRDRQIVRFNACFIDWDCGRGPDGQYWALDHVGAAKAGFLPKLASFAPPASIIVETRNGFHAYWLLEENVTADEFRDGQRRLATFFGSDPKIINPARVMRLPGFDWVKPDSGCDPFPVQVVSANVVRYRLAEIVGSLAVAPANAAPERHSEGTVDCGICAHNKYKSSSRSSPLALIVGAEPVSPLVHTVGAEPASKGVTVSSMAEAIDHLKRQDLAQYLGVGIGEIPVFHCPFHADTRASASIFRNAVTGHYIFTCHSTYCGVAGTIIDVAMHKSGNSAPDAIKQLLAHYRVTIDTGWKDAQKAKLDANIGILGDEAGLKLKYPNLRRLIWRVRADLMEKLQFFHDHVVSERFRVGDEAIFFSSLRRFHKLAARMDEAPRYFNRQNEKVDRYCLLGLLRKIPDSELPEAILCEARKRQAENGHIHRVQFYSVPAYTGEVLQRADDRARKLSEAGASVRGVSRELILDLFGEDVAQEVYPQRAPARVGAGGFAVRLEAVLAAHIESKGYSTVAALRAAMRAESEWRSVTERRIEKALPGILARHGLRKVTCDGPLKASLRIDAPGYPKVIVPKYGPAKRAEEQTSAPRSAPMLAAADATANGQSNPGRPNAPASAPVSDRGETPRTVESTA